MGRIETENAANPDLYVELKNLIPARCRPHRYVSGVAAEGEDRSVLVEGESIGPSKGRQDLDQLLAFGPREIPNLDLIANPPGGDQPSARAEPRGEDPRSSIAELPIE